MVERFTPCDWPHATMVEDSDGGYVSYYDYEKLQQRLATVEAVSRNRLETILLLHDCYRDACSEADSILSDLRKLEAERDRLKAVLVKISEWGCNGQCYDLVKTLCPCCIAKQALEVDVGNSSNRSHCSMRAIFCNGDMFRSYYHSENMEG